MPSVQDLVNMGYVGYSGWNDAAATADFQATGGRGKEDRNRISSSSQSSNSQDPLEIAKKIREFTVQANQPAIQSFQSAIPETQQKFATERQNLTQSKEPLKQRYSNLLAQLTNKEKQATDRETLRINNELGRRGISSNSGVYERELTQGLNPITETYAGLTKETGIAQEESLQGIDKLIAMLTGQETDATRAIQNAIASLQAGEPASAVSSAINLSNIGSNQAYQNELLGMRGREQNLAEQIFNLTTLPQSQANVAATNALAQQRRSGSSSGDLSGLEALFEQFNQ